MQENVFYTLYYGNKWKKILSVPQVETSAKIVLLYGLLMIILKKSHKEIYSKM